MIRDQDAHLEYFKGIGQSFDLVRACGLDVSGLLALVAHALIRGLRGAVAAEMADFTT